ncbi:MAG: iron ABC transporter substrate-binding protein, partial [Acidobacteriota bacterium]
NIRMTAGPVPSFLNLAGAGQCQATPGARQLLEYLVSDEAQQYFAVETFEYPLVAGVALGADLLPIDEISDAARLDFATVAENLEPTLRAISETGLLQ